MQYGNYGYNPAMPRYGYGQQTSQYNGYSQAYPLPAFNYDGTSTPNLDINPSSFGYMNRLDTPGNSAVDSQAVSSKEVNVVSASLEDEASTDLTDTEESSDTDVSTQFEDNVAIIETLIKYGDRMWRASGCPKSGSSGSPERMKQMTKEGLNAILKDKHDYPQELKDAIKALQNNTELEKKVFGDDDICQIQGNSISIGSLKQQNELKELINDKNRTLTNAAGVE